MIYKISMLLFILNFSFYSQCFAQSEKPVAVDIVCWQENIKLKVQDFKSRSRPKMNELSYDSASTAYCKPTLSVKSIFEGNKTIFLVQAFLDKNKSWISNPSSPSVWLILEHEQLHFDICELIARKIRARIEYLQGRGEINEIELNKEISNLFAENKLLQEEYDAETEHGIRELQQQKWNKKIRIELSKLEKYKSTATDCRPL